MKNHRDLRISILMNMMLTAVELVFEWIGHTTRTHAEGGKLFHSLTIKLVTEKLDQSELIYLQINFDPLFRVQNVSLIINN